ncbi:helix-turn-helix domain-containing protein [Parasedimentitalea maritima]|uniref:Helix-turn-helix domain-containing protein n=2 Tax=Parasedimentitalea maritima TaxID=2578117 RepID=A0ABY2UWX7_9RHOB|nr:response regulator transcription factor [Zongyanglinia marina]TLP64352.1 helix-turn-helix domain-containing protein [Zongyanglinia marina]
MPYDPSPIDEIEVMPLSGLYSSGPWQTELAHDRDRHLLVWITRGQGRVLLNGARRGFSSHNALFIPAGNLFALDVGRGTLGQVMLVPASNAISLPHQAQHLRISDPTEQASLTSLLEVMRREQSKNEALWHRAMQAYGELVGILLQRQTSRITPQPARRSAAKRLSLAYCSRISQFHRENISMADHATALGVTATHLTRVVKAETGTTAASLLTERQLYAAHRLLIESDMPIQNVAAQLNFRSAAYFTRFITLHTKRTPSALRKQSRS